MALITLTLPCRINEKFSNFERYFDKLLENLDNISNVEVIIKFDDDQDISEAEKIIEFYRNKGVTIKHFKSPRLKGYQNLYIFLLECLFLSDSKSIAISNQSIDGFIAKKGFDTVILESAQKYEDGYFVIHPACTFSFKDTVTDVNKAVQYLDTFPIWSRKWIETQGAFGYCSSTDGYTALVEFILATEYGIDRRIDISQHAFISETDCGDIESNYWKGVRKIAIETHLTEQNISFARSAARNIALNIANSWRRDDYMSYIVQSCLNAYDGKLLLEKRLNELALLPINPGNQKTSSPSKAKKYKRRFLLAASILMISLATNIFIILAH